MNPLAYASHLENRKRLDAGQERSHGLYFAKEASLADMIFRNTLGHSYSCIFRLIIIKVSAEIINYIK